MLPFPRYCPLSPVQRLEVTEQGRRCRHGIWKYEQRGGAEPEGVWAVRAETQHSTAAEGLHCPAVHLQARQAHGLPQGVLRKAGEGLCVCFFVILLKTEQYMHLYCNRLLMSQKLAKSCHHKLHLFTLGRTMFTIYFLGKKKNKTHLWCSGCQRWSSFSLIYPEALCVILSISLASHVLGEIFFAIAKNDCNIIKCKLIGFLSGMLAPLKWQLLHAA